jgi:hypothetical protein
LIGGCRNTRGDRKRPVDRSIVNHRAIAGLYTIRILRFCRAEASSAAALIAYLKLQIKKLKRELCGRRSERTARLLYQLELQLGGVGDGCQ